MAADGNGAGRGELLEHVIRVLEEITDDWDVGPISADSRLASLNLESINLVYFIAELQQKYGLRQQLFTRIRSTARALGDLRVGDIVDLVHEIQLADPDRHEEPAS